MTAATILSLKIMTKLVREMSDAEFDEWLTRSVRSLKTGTEKNPAAPRNTDDDHQVFLHFVEVYSH